jgi:hypothetical protein
VLKSVNAKGKHDVHDAPNHPKAPPFSRRAWLPPVA